MQEVARTSAPSCAEWAHANVSAFCSMQLTEVVRRRTRHSTVSTRALVPAALSEPG